MKIAVYWRKDKIKSIKYYEIWQFWSANRKFSCSCRSINKKRRPERVFLGFAHYRPLNSYEYQEMGKFEMEERERHIKTIKS